MAVMLKHSREGEHPAGTGSGLELFVDGITIGGSTGVSLMMHEPKQQPLKNLPRGHFRMVIREAGKAALYDERQRFVFFTVF